MVKRRIKLRKGIHINKLPNRKMWLSLCLRATIRDTSSDQYAVDGYSYAGPLCSEQYPHALWLDEMLWIQRWQFVNYDTFYTFTNLIEYDHLRLIVKRLQG